MGLVISFRIFVLLLTPCIYSLFDYLVVDFSLLPNVMELLDCLLLIKFYILLTRLRDTSRSGFLVLVAHIFYLIALTCILLETSFCFVLWVLSIFSYNSFEKKAWSLRRSGCSKYYSSYSFFISYTSAIITENWSPHATSITLLFWNDGTLKGTIFFFVSPVPRLPLLLTPSAQR